jgi:hypothetical protein
LRQNKILEEDLPFIVEKQAYVEKTGKSLKEIYLPLKSSDTFLIEHRKWLDKFGQNFPSYQGFTTVKRNPNRRLEQMSFDRFSRHTKICTSCDRTYQIIDIFKQVLIAVAIIFVGLGIVTEDNIIKTIFVIVSILAIGKAAILQKLKTHFDNSYHK